MATHSAQWPPDCLSTAELHDVRCGNLTSEVQQRQLVSVLSWTTSVQVPCIAQSDIDAECEETPPPLLAAYGDAVQVQILIHAISAAHAPVVLGNGCRLSYVHLALLGR